MYSMGSWVEFGLIKCNTGGLCDGKIYAICCSLEKTCYQIKL